MIAGDETIHSLFDGIGTFSLFDIFDTLECVTILHVVRTSHEDVTRELVVGIRLVENLHGSLDDASVGENVTEFNVLDGTRFTILKCDRCFGGETPSATPE